jgi:uncharacterized membrane protein
MVEPTDRGLGVIGDRLERVRQLDVLADRLGRLLDRVPDGTASILRGEWLGHPLHPMLTDLPIGFWTSAWTLDLVGGAEAEQAADLLLGIGVLTAAPTVAAGMADWATLGRGKRRVGIVHAAANAVATGLFAASWGSRRRGDRTRGKVLGHLGATVATVGGFLGGHLADPRS